MNSQECKHFQQANQDYYKIPKVLRTNAPKPEYTGYNVSIYGISQTLSAYKTSELKHYTVACYCNDLENDVEFRSNPDHKNLFTQLKEMRKQTVHLFEQDLNEVYSDKEYIQQLISEFIESIERGEETYYEEGCIETDPPIYNYILNGENIEFSI